jgi:hypothetical protein
MAIQKTKTLGSGASGNYWKITKCSYNRMSKVCEWTISLFKDYDHRNSTPLPLHKVFFKTLSPTEAAMDRAALGYTTIAAQAAEMIKPPFTVDPEAALIVRDPDLAGGENV